MRDLNKLNIIDDALSKAYKAKSFDAGYVVAKEVISLFGIKDFNSELKIFPKLRDNPSWIKNAPEYKDRKASYALCTNNDKNIDFKIYWVPKKTKRIITNLVALTPNFEDDEAIYANEKVGIDFILSDDADELTIALSKNYKVRTLELHEKLTNTQKEILRKWIQEFDFNNKASFHQVIWDSFDISPVNKAFYKEISSFFKELCQHLEEKNILDKKQRSRFVNRLIGRIVFCWFLRKKEIIADEAGYFEINNLNSKDYYNKKLEKLFFKVLNTAIEERINGIERNTPFLNGGLFEPKATDLYEQNKLSFPDDYFDRFYDFLHKYNFTTDESTSDFQQVAIDPEMLGRVFENLLAEEVEETGEQARKAKGAFYTPREIVDYMCKTSLKEHISDKFGNEPKKDKVLELLFDKKEHDFDYKNDKTDIGVYKHKLLEILENIKIIDPACGSGAFPIGMMQLILSLYERIETRFDSYKTKLSIIKNNIYGVDIEPMAVEISRLRTWLSLVVDQKVNLKEDNLGIEPLPNLDFKFVCANSLVSLEKNDTSSFGDKELEENIQEIRDKYFNARSLNSKNKYKKEYENLLNKEKNLFSSSKQNQLLSYHPFDSDNICSFFDSNFMFGVESFDLIIGNPPYLGEKGHKEIFSNVKKGDLRDFYLGKMDYFYFFFHKAINIGKLNSHIAFITTNYYVTATGAKKLRDDFKSRTTIKNLINFNELKIFESALGQHNMITILSKSKNSDIKAKTCITTRRGFAIPEILHEVIYRKDKETKYCSVSQQELYDGSENYIRFDNNSNVEGKASMQNILEKMKEQGNPLKVFCNVNQGIVTGADKVNNKHIETYGIKSMLSDGIFVLNENNENDVEVLNAIIQNNEQELLKPFFKNSDIYKYCSNNKTNLKLLHLDRQSKDINDYKIIKKHLNKFESLLKERREVKNNVIKYHQLTWPRTNKIFISPKIVAPQRSKTNIFGYNEIPWYSSADVYYITELNEDISLKYILALLNSNLYYSWLYHRGKRKGEDLELYQVPLSEIPIKKVSSNEQEKYIKIVDKIIGVVNHIDYHNDPLKDKVVKNYQLEIDQMVYDLYGLTKKEVEIINKIQN